MSAMKRVEALIRPERLEAVKIALSEAEVTGLNVSNVVGRGEMPPEERRAGRAGETVLVELLPKLKLETIVSDWNVENVIAVIREHGGVGDLGDGLIFVSDVEEAVSIRTGERGNDMAGAHGSRTHPGRCEPPRNGFEVRRATIAWCRLMPQTPVWWAYQAEVMTARRGSYRAVPHRWVAKWWQLRPT